MEKKTDKKNLIKETYARGSVSETLAEVNDGVSTDTSATLGTQPPASSGVDKARAGKYPAVPDQSGRNSELGDSEGEYKAVHNDQPAPDYRDEIYREKPVEGRVANNQ